MKAKQIEAEVEVEKQRKVAEVAKAMRDQKAKESGIDRSAVIAGIDPVLHNNMVADLRQEISNLKEKLTLNSNDNFEGINSVESVNYIRGKRSLEQGEDLAISEDAAVKKLDEVISRYSDSNSVDESLEDSSGGIGSINGSDTNDVVSRIVPQSNTIVSETVQAELAGIEKELHSQELKAEGEVEAVEDILVKT